MFESLSILSNYLQQFGVWAPAIAFVLFAIQAAVPVFPYVILAAGGGMLFGFKLGTLLAWSGALAGACLCFWFCRLLGYNTVSRWLLDRYGYEPGKHSASNAFWGIIIARIIPFVPTPMINAAAAFGGVSFWNFLLASAIGKVPTAVLYTGLGLALFNAGDINTILLIISAAIILLLVLHRLGHKYFAQQSKRTAFPEENELLYAEKRKTM